MKKIKLLNLGGTITSVRDPKTGGLRSGSLTGEELIEQSGLGSLNLNLDIENFKSLPSTEISLEDLREVKARIDEIISQGEFEGIVITHGTDTMEETAYMLNLIVDAKIPIVMTGSQRSIKDLGFDGSGNIRDAIIVASDNASQGKGVLLVFNQEILPAKFAFKSNSTGLRGFTAQGTGPLGNVYGGEANYYYDISPNKTLEILDKPFTNKVYLFKMALDYPIDIIEAAIENSCDGIVLEGFGIGAVTPDTQDVLEKAISKGIPVVLTTRSETGGVRALYASKGAGVQLKDLGVIFESEISGVKARLKLIALLNSRFKNELEEHWLEY